jgi:hypothetical protein
MAWLQINGSAHAGPAGRFQGWRADHTQEFSPRGGVAREFAGERLRYDPFVTASHFAEQLAQLFGFDHASRAARMTLRDQRICNLIRRPFLIDEPVTYRETQPDGGSSGDGVPPRNSADSPPNCSAPI